MKQSIKPIIINRDMVFLIRAKPIKIKRMRLERPIKIRGRI